jgi:hypothetical protein
MAETARKLAEFEAEGPNGVSFKFVAPADSSPEQLKRFALIEYQMMTQGRSPSLRDIESRGEPTPPNTGAATQEPESVGTPAPSESPEDFEKRVASAAQQQDIRQAQMLGGATGAGITAGRAAADAAGAAAQNLAQRAEAGRIAAQQSAGRPAPTPSRIMASPPGSAPTSAQATRIMQGGPNDIAGTTGRAREAGFNIETAQRAAAEKEAAARAEQLRQQGLVSQSARQVLANAPGQTMTDSGISIPRDAKPAVYAAPPAPPTVPPRPSGLDQVTAMFGRMITPVGAAMRYALPPVALAGAAGEGIRAKQQLEQESPDTAGAALSGISALSGLAALSPAAAPLAVPVGLGAGALQYMRGRLEPDDRPLTSYDKMMASRPAFGIYPPAGQRRPLRAPPLTSQ